MKLGDFLKDFEKDNKFDDIEFMYWDENGELRILNVMKIDRNVRGYVSLVLENESWHA